MERGGGGEGEREGRGDGGGGGGERGGGVEGDGERKDGERGGGGGEREKMGEKKREEKREEKRGEKRGEKREEKRGEKRGGDTTTFYNLQRRKKETAAYDIVGDELDHGRVVIDWFNGDSDIGGVAPLPAVKDFKHDPRG